MDGYYTFIFKHHEEEEKCCIIPVTIFEEEYAPLEKETYIFLTYHCQEKNKKKS